ncbi:hypothetical protein N0V90_005834 [Kalmusia sp. IMI 367209]|nr:hypothetical protein N0V90_005834 [Kalmusia sp. IMI 367209]
MAGRVWKAQRLWSATQLPSASKAIKYRQSSYSDHCRGLATVVERNEFGLTTAVKDPYWRKIPMWKDMPSDVFIKYEFQAILPDILPLSKNPLLHRVKTRDDFIRDAKEGLEIAPMTIRLTPQILSRVNWESPLDDPIRLQFLPLKSGIRPDHAALTVDSLEEEADSRGTTNVIDKKPQRPTKARWDIIFDHIEKDKTIKDIVLSGGDCYYLSSEDLQMIGQRLLKIPHIRRFRIASKGLAVAPSRVLDETDTWTKTLIDLTRQGRELGKQVCWHTHFNHPSEITWITREAARYLFGQGVIIRNQSVLLKGVNDDFETMRTLIESLADMNVQPYYVYQCDQVRGIEDLRTPLKTIRNLDKRLRGTLSGFMMPSFVVDLPGGGGKRLVSTAEDYDETTGVSTWRAPGLPGEKGQKTYTYHDPHPWEPTDQNIQKLHEAQNIMYKNKTTRPGKLSTDHDKIFKDKTDLHASGMDAINPIIDPTISSAYISPSQ